MWCDGQVCPDVGQELWHLGPTARVCICVLRPNRTKEAGRDFCGLPIRRDMECVVDMLLLFKIVFSGDEEEPCPGDQENLGEGFCPGSRELERRALDGTDEKDPGMEIT
ncbi:hypothetical protein TNCV_2191691 [Trichonephila clavipes]|nr:hypothetical protein TNCV_2191691 [Trichonephila clavipes]